MAKKQAAEEKQPKEKLKYTVPKNIGAAIELLNDVRVSRKAMTAKAESEKRQETMIEEAIFGMFKKSELEGARGKRGTLCSIKRSDVYNIDDFDKVWSYAKKNDAPDLFRRQLVVEAVRERFMAGKTIPGVSTFTKVSLSLTGGAKGKAAAAAK